MITGPPLHDGSTLILFTTLFIIIFLLGIFGNSLIIAVVRRTRDLQSNTNFFLCNLAVSDLILLTSGIPFDLIYMWRTYPAIAGTWHCILKAQLSETASNVSILTILVLTAERWVAVCRPLHLYLYFNKDRTYNYILAIWLIGALSALPLSIQFSVIPYRPLNSTVVYEFVTQCDLEPSRSIPYIFEITSVLFFILPMSFIITGYGLIVRELNRSKGAPNIHHATLSTVENRPQSKAKVLIIMMLITVVSVFFFCFLPLHIQRLLTTYDRERISSSHENAQFSQIWFTIAGLLHYVSSASNPIIYNIMSRRFRSACRSMIFSFTNWYKAKLGCPWRCVHDRYGRVDGIFEMVPVVVMPRYPSTETTTLREKMAKLLMGGRRGQCQPCQPASGSKEQL